MVEWGVVVEKQKRGDIVWSVYYLPAAQSLVLFFVMGVHWLPIAWLLLCIIVSWRLSVFDFLWSGPLYSKMVSFFIVPASIILAIYSGGLGKVSWMVAGIFFVLLVVVLTVSNFEIHSHAKK
jgi:hypothetical protein